MSSTAVEYELRRAELAHRSSDGVDVALLWSRVTDSLYVAVRDERTNASFELVVENGSEALDVFHHPFAYAAWRGIELEAGEESYA
jgi:hypothetical protein